MDDKYDIIMWRKEKHDIQELIDTPLIEEKPTVVIATMKSEEK